MKRRLLYALALTIYGAFTAFDWLLRLVGGTALYQRLDAWAYPSVPCPQCRTPVYEGGAHHVCPAPRPTAGHAP